MCKQFSTKATCRIVTIFSIRHTVHNILGPYHPRYIGMSYRISSVIYHTRNSQRQPNALTHCLVRSIFVVVKGEVAIAHHSAHLRELVIVVPIVGKSVQKHAKAWE